MNTIEVQNIIVQSFDQQWSSCAVEHQNTTIDKDSLDEWVRLTIQHYRPEIINLKLNAVRSGVVHIQVFTKLDIGQGRATALACSAGDLVKSFGTGSLVFKPYELVILGRKATEGLTTTETNWFQVNAAIEFSFVD